MARTKKATPAEKPATRRRTPDVLQDMSVGERKAWLREEARIARGALRVDLQQYLLRLAETL